MDTGDFTYNGIDRVDNTKGYQVNNCVASCFICNKAKGVMTQSEFLNWIQDLIEFRKTKFSMNSSSDLQFDSIVVE